MKKMMMVPAILVAALLVWSGCTYKKEVEVYPPAATCDTTNVRYSVEVAGIISANCYSCHATAVANSSGGGNRLEGYNNLKIYASSGVLLSVLNHEQGYSPMPKNASKLSDCDIAKIRTWIRNGMPNN
jgi:mono/diheme cytochrome c family protein